MYKLYILYIILYTIYLNRLYLEIMRCDQNIITPPMSMIYTYRYNIFLFYIRIMCFFSSHIRRVIPMCIILLLPILLLLFTYYFILYYARMYYIIGLYVYCI